MINFFLYIDFQLFFALFFFFWFLKQGFFVCLCLSWNLVCCTHVETVQKPTRDLDCMQTHDLDLESGWAASFLE